MRRRVNICASTGKNIETKFKFTAEKKLKNIYIVAISMLFLICLCNYSGKFEAGTKLELFQIGEVNSGLMPKNYLVATESFKKITQQPKS